MYNCKFNKIIKILPQCWVTECNFCCNDYSCSWLSLFGEQGWHSGESTRLPPMSPGFKSRRRHHNVGWICCWFSPCSESFFSGHSSFPLSLKSNISNNSISNARTRFNEFLWTPKCFVGKQTTNYNLQQIHHNNGNACFFIAYKTPSAP